MDRVFCRITKDSSTGEVLRDDRSPALMGRDDLESVIGGGSTPAQSIPTCLISVSAGTPAALEKTLREGDPPVITRVENERVLLDLRTVFPDDETALGQALASALQSGE